MRYWQLIDNESVFHYLVSRFNSNARAAFAAVNYKKDKGHESGLYLSVACVIERLLENQS